MQLAAEMAWYVPLLIFFGRICDVSLGTIRTILVIGGHPWISAFLGFFEVIIWVLAIGGVIMYLTNVFALLGYASGFAAGVVIGMLIESRIALGYRVVRIISPNIEISVSERLRERGFSVTRLEGRGRSGPVEFAFMVVRRRDVRRIRAALLEIDPKAYISISQADRPSTAMLMTQDSRFGRRFLAWGAGLRK